ncbi:DUF4349 domain-containing protein [Thalassoporum mexicanum]|uniref:DUF4349 domain-containing protein n=1 Tax=Thalassoporum mexicanum TaxID=3457544 RepID=UPI0002DF091C|nr:DUF4349 domain-containing protein [Pseudanabaena sp. PCC 7367]
MSKHTSAQNSIGDRPLKKTSLKIPLIPLISTLAGIALSSCASSPSAFNQTGMEAPSMDVATEEMVVAQADPSAPVDTVPSSATTVPKPQLIKTAEVALVSDSVDDAIAAINQIVDIQQGDIAILNDIRESAIGT